MMMLKTISLFPSKSPTRIFFKFFYVFCIAYSAFAICDAHGSDDQDSFTQIFVYAVLAMLSVFGLIFDFLRYSFAEKSVTYWTSVFLGLVLANNLIMHDWTPNLITSRIFTPFFFFGITLYRFFYLKSEIKYIIKTIKKTSEIMEKPDDGQ